MTDPITLRACMVGHPDPTADLHDEIWWVSTNEPTADGRMRSRWTCRICGATGEEVSSYCNFSQVGAVVRRGMVL